MESNDVLVQVLNIVAEAGVEIVALLIATALSRVVVMEVAAFIRAKLSEKQAKLLGQAARLAVRYAEQWLADEDNAEKKAAAEQYVEDYLAQFGITVEVDLIADTIEAVLKEEKIWGPLLVEPAGQPT